MKTLRTKSGDRVYQVLTIKVFNVGNRGCTKRRLRAAKGQAFTDEVIDNLLLAAAADLEKRFPDDEWGCVEVGPGAVNLVWRGKRQASVKTLAAKSS